MVDHRPELLAPALPICGRVGNELAEVSQHGVAIPRTTNELRDIRMRPKVCEGLAVLDSWLAEYEPLSSQWL